MKPNPNTTHKKYLIIGDIHGRLIWRDIIEKEQPDITVFLGDYVSTHEGISSEQQINNLKDILDYKEENPDTVILLRGNHDMQHLAYPWAECSGEDWRVLLTMKGMKDRFLAATQWLYLIEPNILCSHAGVSTVWLRDSLGMSVSDPGWIDKVNAYPPSELFGFIPNDIWDTSGDSPTQPPTWIRPDSLLECMSKGFVQIVGHSPIKQGAINLAEAMTANGSIRTLSAVKREAASRLWLADALHCGDYVVVDNGEIKIKRINNNRE